MGFFRKRFGVVVTPLTASVHAYEVSFTKRYGWLDAFELKNIR